MQAELAAHVEMKVYSINWGTKNTGSWAARV